MGTNRLRADRENMRKLMANKHTIELTDKELFNLWVVACWFNKPVVTDTLKHKLAGLATSEYREKHDTKVEKAVMQRIIDLGKWLEANGYGE